MTARGAVGKFYFDGQNGGVLPILHFLSGSFPTLGIKDPESGLAAEAVGKTVSFPETPFSAANQEKFRMTVYGMKQILPPA